ncbi:DUF998 domain-containing protein [Nocardioides sp. B-3]|nr:DUF998 domain-containing protein [Nocardioides sp. B-3]
MTAAATTGGYDFVTDTVSKLGEIGCSEAYCSPRHEVMNGSFMAYGALLAGGALLSNKELGPWVTGLLIVSGASSVATGLAPLDRGRDLARHRGDAALRGAALCAGTPRSPDPAHAARTGQGVVGDRRRHRRRGGGVRGRRRGRRCRRCDGTARVVAGALRAGRVGVGAAIYSIGGRATTRPA